MLRIKNEFHTDPNWIAVGFINDRPDPIDGRFSLSDTVEILYYLDITYEKVITECREMYLDFTESKNIRNNITKAVCTLSEESILVTNNKDIALDKAIKTLKEKYPKYEYRGCPVAALEARESGELYDWNNPD